MRLNVPWLGMSDGVLVLRLEVDKMLAEDVTDSDTSFSDSDTHKPSTHKHVSESISIEAHGRGDALISMRQL